MEGVLNTQPHAIYWVVQLKSKPLLNYHLIVLKALQRHYILV